MADVFISYSRKDDEFAKRLTNALKKQERDVWIDWEDIPRAADWLNEIYAGIESADTFILIVTQHSLTSEICAYEIAHARKHNKRIVPLIRQRIEGDIETLVKGQWMDKAWEQVSRENWQQLGHLNWIFFEDDEQFDAEFTTLTETLQTDVEHVNLHTRLLVRAREWENGGNNPSFLLKGDEISSAEKWLQAAEAENKTPQPTQLHHDYILKSGERERAETRRLRNLRRATIIAVVIGVASVAATIFSGGTAIDARNQAEIAATNAALADNNAATATIAQGQALIQADRASTQAAAAGIAASAEANARATSRINEQIAQTQAAIALENAATATIAQGQALIQADRASTQAAIADARGTEVAQKAATSDANANLAATNEAEALRQSTAVANQAATSEANANIAATNAALAEVNEWKARSLVMAANARNLINDGENRLGLALAIAAYQAYDPPLTDVQQTLARAIYGPSARLRLEADTQSVLDVALNSDGTTVYSVSSDGKLIFWDLDSNTILDEVTFAGGQVANNVTVNPDGTRLVVSLVDNSLRLLDAADGSEIRSITGHEGLIMQVAFSPNGDQLLSGGLDRTLRLWDVETGEQLQLIESPGAILNLAFSPDGRQAVTGSGDNIITGSESDRVIDRTVRVWNLRTGQELHRFTPNSGFVRAVAFSPDGSSIAAGTWNSTDEGRLYLWSIVSGDLQDTFYGHTDVISSVAFSPDGRRLYSTSWDRTLRVWDIATSLEIQQFREHEDRVLAMAVSPNGGYVLTGTGNTGNVASNLELDLAVDPTIWIWDLQNYLQIHVLEGHSDWVWGVDISPDDTLVASSSGPLRLPALDASIRLWDVATGEQIRRLEGHTDTIQSVNFSPDGSLLASASWDETVWIWDVATGEGRIGYDGHTDNVLSVIFSTDGESAFSTSADRTIQMWDVETGEEIKRFIGHSGAVNSVALSPDGTQILTASDDRTIRLWDVETATEIKQFIGHSDRINNAVFSPDGTRILSTSWDTSAREWDVASGKEIKLLFGHTGPVFGVDYSPDGRTALTTSADLTIRLWDTITGQEIRRFEGHTNWILSVVFSTDHNFAVSGAEDNTVRVWRVESTLAGLVNWAYANRHVPELTCAQREQYGVEPLCHE